MNLEYSLRGHKQACTAIHISSENRQLITGDESGVCIIWSLDFRRPLFKFHVGKSSILSINQFKDLYLVQNRENMIQFFRAPEDQCCSILGKVVNRKDGASSSWSCSLQDRKDGDGTSSSWSSSPNPNPNPSNEKDQEELVPILQLPCESLHFCQFKKRKNMILFTLSCPFRLVLFSMPLDEKMTADLDLRSFLIFIDLPTDKGSCIAIEFLNDSSAVAGFEDGSLIVQDFFTGSRKELETRHSEVVLCVGVSSHSIVSASADQLVLIHDYNGKVKVEIQLDSPGVSSLGIFEDFFVVCSWAGDIILYSYLGESIGPTFREHRKSLRSSAAACLTQRPSWNQLDNEKKVKTVFIGSEDCRVSCWILTLEEK
jgi:hypothetical protein